MKIKITTDRMVWVNDRAHPQGAEVEVSAADAHALIELGFAETIKSAPKVPAK
jgi:hypothetical protein